MSMRSNILRPVQHIRNAFSSRMRVELWLLEGSEKSSGEPLCVAYTGDSERHRRYFAKTAFREDWKTRCLGREWLWRVASRVKREAPSCPLIVYEISDSSRLPRWGSHFLRSPVWLKFHRRMEPSWPPSGPHYREIQRRIRKHGLSSSTGKAETDFDDFYHNMYVPNILNRHGDSGAVQDYEAVKKILLSHGELMLIHRGGQAVAGGLQDFSGSKSHFHSLGIRGGDEALMKLGVVEALYYFVLQRAYERGEASVSLGSCRAFFGDGVFRFKVRLGGQVGCEHNPIFGCIYFQFFRRSPGLDAFLRENPFVAWESQDKYRGIVFMDQAPAVEALDETLDAKHCRGINEWTLYEFDGSIKKTVKTEKGRRIHIVPVASLLPGSSCNG